MPCQSHLKSHAHACGMQDITMNHASLEDIVAKPDYFGVTVGRVANRIAKGAFVLDGVVRPTPLHCTSSLSDRPSLRMVHAVRSHPCVMWLVGAQGRGERRPQQLPWRRRGV